MRSIKCPICGIKFNEKEEVYRHIEEAHSDILPEEFSGARYYFNYINKKTHGSCIICGKETKWNEATVRYEKFDKEACKREYVKQFEARMKNKYGKERLLDDPDVQTKMLKNRSISGKYTFKDKGKIDYTGSYEKDFLQFLDVFLDFNSTDIVAPCPHVFDYNYQGKNLFYIPDFYIPSINTIIEIKDGGNNPNTHGKIQSVDKEKERLKDEVMKNQKQYNFIKITNKEYGPFLQFLINLKIDASSDKKEDNPLVMINESFIDLLLN